MLKNDEERKRERVSTISVKHSSIAERHRKIIIMARGASLSLSMRKSLTEFERPKGDCFGHTVCAGVRLKGGRALRERELLGAEFRVENIRTMSSHAPQRNIHKMTID